MTSFAFDAVLFDLDGTLVATERYWPDAARAATRRFFTECGLEHPVPSTGEWMTMVGQPMAEAFRGAFPGLDGETAARLRRACEAEEARLLERGHAELLPGAREVLEGLRAKGVRIGVASNCGMGYLDAMLEGLGLNRWVEEARCLSSRGIASKTEMIADLLATFGTRDAVMVGDRSGDRDASWANGLPHVHIPRGYGGALESVAAEAQLDALDQLIPRLEQRDATWRSMLSAHSEEVPWVIVGLSEAGPDIVAKGLGRCAAAAGRVLDVRVIEPLPGELDSGRGAGAVRVHVVACEEALVRRARGRRVGMGPVEELMERLPLAAAQLRSPEPGAWLVDTSNFVAPTALPL